MNTRTPRWLVGSVLVFACSAAIAAQGSPEGFAFERPIRTQGEGPKRLSIDAPLLAAGAPFRIVTRGDRQVAEGGLTDLRLFDKSGRAVPHLLVHRRAPERPRIAGLALAIPSKPTSGARVPLEVPFDRESSEPGRSRYRIRLPGPRLPAIALEVRTASGHVFRTATVSESRFAGGEAAPTRLGTATLSRVVRDDAEASDLIVPIEPPTESEIQLQIDDGSNPPLEITGVRLHLAELPVIYFESPGGEVVARYGNRAAEPPSYDLEALRRTLDVTQVPEAQWGEPRALAPVEVVGGATSVPQPGGTLDAQGFRHLRAIPGDRHGLIALQLDASVLANSRGPSGRFDDVRVLDSESRQIPYLLERRDEPLQIDLRLEPATSSLEELKRAPGRQLSIYSVPMPERHLPGATIVLDTSARVFQRSVRVGVSRGADRTRREPWFETLASATWRHADEQTVAPALSIKIDPVDSAELLIVVDEGDNAALPIRSGRLLLPSYRIRFYHPEGAALRLAYGRDDIQAPLYDLELLAQRVMGAQATVVNAGASEPAAPPANEFIPLPLFWGLLAVAVLVILGLIVKLVKQ